MSSIAEVSPALAAGLGIAVSYVVAVVKQPRLGRRLTTALTVALSLGAGFLAAKQTGQINPNDVITSGVIVLTVSQVFYRTIGKNLGLPELEKATTVTAGEEPEAVEAPVRSFESRSFLSGGTTVPEVRAAEDFEQGDQLLADFVAEFRSPPTLYSAAQAEAFLDALPGPEGFVAVDSRGVPLLALPGNRFKSRYDDMPLDLAAYPLQVIYPAAGS